MLSSVLLDHELGSAHFEIEIHEELGYSFSLLSTLLPQVLFLKHLLLLDFLLLIPLSSHFLLLLCKFHR